jgi:hypothetical protein
VILSGRRLSSLSDRFVYEDLQLSEGTAAERCTVPPSPMHRQRRSWRPRRSQSG